MNRVLFSSASVHWATPPDVYAALDAEFHFTLDPCPLGGAVALDASWFGQRVFCNPPYARGEIAKWLQRASEAELAVYLLPSRTGTTWWHEYAMKANEIRFLRGRLRFSGAENVAPFDSVVLVYNNLTSTGRRNAA